MVELTGVWDFMALCKRIKLAKLALKASRACLGGAKLGRHGLIESFDATSVMRDFTVGKLGDRKNAADRLG